MSEEETEHINPDYIKEGHKLLNSKKYNEAVETFDKLIAIDPENELAYLAKANALSHLNRLEESLEASERVIEIYEEHPETLNKTTSLNHSMACFGKAEVLNKLGRHEEALEASEIIIKKYENYSEALDEIILMAYSGSCVYKGDALCGLNRYEQAIEAYDKATEIKPGNIEAWNRKFYTLWENHKPKEALETIDKAISTTELKDKKDFWEIKGLALTLIERYGEALEAFNSGIDVNQEYSQLWLDKGDVFFQLGAYRYALKSYEKAITIEPKNATAWKYKSVCLFYLKRHTEFQEALTQALNLDPKDAEIFNILADYHLKFGDIENASKYVENSLLIDKEKAFSFYIKGKIKIEKQDYITSIRCFKKAISLDLRNPIYLLWDSYAKYLMAELELAADEKKYQDAILGIIRELGSVNNCNYIEYKNSYKMISWFFNIAPHNLKNLIIDALNAIKKALIDRNMSEKNTVKLLEIIDQLSSELENTKNIAYNYYFLGCFYYKINDYLTAIDGSVLIFL